MINQLTPDQIAARWEEIKGPLTSSYLPSSDDEGRMLRLLDSLMNGHAQLWQLDYKDEMRAIGVTVLGKDFLNQTTNLYFIAMHIFKQAPLNIWADAVNVLKVFAKSNGCVNLIGSTPNKKIVRLMKILGGRIEYASYFNLTPAVARNVSYDSLEKEVLV